MTTPPHVLIITNDDAIRNLLEQVFIIRGIKLAIAATAQGAEALKDLWGLGSFTLVIIDTAALGPDDMQQQRAACQLLEDWTAQHPTLPFLFLGTVLQKHAVHAIRADIVRFLLQPFSLDDLVEAVETLYPREGGCRTPLSYKT